MNGNADTNLIITVPPHNDMLPPTITYPKKEVIINITNITKPENHKILI